LRARGTIVPIEPQVFDLLVYLIQNRDRVVSKNDLIATVWGGRIVSDSTLDSRINAVRRAIGYSGDQQELVRTIPRKGVRFVGDVQQDRTQHEANNRLPGFVHKQEISFCRSADNINIAYAAVGNGPALIKAANWLTHLEYDWESPVWAPLLQRLAERNRLIRYDTRGTGLSDREVAEFPSMVSPAISNPLSKRSRQTGLPYWASRKAQPLPSTTLRLIRKGSPN
jgi:DNA-binding winged helix-turn-helix (wHTH) protein